MIDETAQVNTMDTNPKILPKILDVDSQFSWNENRTVLDLTYTSFDCVSRDMLWVETRLTIQLLNRIDAEQMNYFMEERSERTRVQLSKFSSDFQYFYIRYTLYRPAMNSWLYSVIYVPFRFLYMEQNELFLQAVVFAISLFNGATFSAQITATSSTPNLKLFDTKQFSRECRLFLINSSPTAKATIQITAIISDAIYISVQHTYAFQDLFDFYAIRNRCFQTYMILGNIISKVIQIWKYQFAKRQFLINIKHLIFFTIQNKSIQYQLLTHPCMIDRTNKQGKRFSTIFISQGEDRDSFRKSTQQQYDQIFKALSTNYFAKVASTSRMSKLSETRNCLSVQSVGFKTPDPHVPHKVEKYLDQEPFDEKKEINKMMKLGDIFEDSKFCKVIKNPFDIFKRTQPKREKMRNTKFKPQNLLEHQSQKMAMKTYPTKQRPKTSKVNKYERIRTNRRSQEKLSLKFVKLDKNQPSSQIKKLKKAVQCLENIAIDQYGLVCFQNKMVHKEIDMFSDFEENSDPKLKQLETKLKQFKSLEKEATVPEDSSIPISFLKIVGVKKSSTSRSSFNKRTSPRLYLRV